MNMTGPLAKAARSLLAPRRPTQIEPPPPAPERRTCPDAVMTLMLRFETELGPRTIVAPRVPLKFASEIADAMILAGHYAEMVDHYPPLTVAERTLWLKAPARARDTVLALARRMA
jgi:hypothetical protein